MSFGYNLYTTAESGLNNANRACSDIELEINCVGNYSMQGAKFTSNNPSGRLDYYLLYIKEGKLTLYLQDEQRMLCEGEFIIIPPKTPYKYSHDGKRKLEYLWVHFTGSAVEERLAEYGLEKFPKINVTTPDSSVPTRFQSIYSACAKQDNFRRRELSVLLERLLISLARRVGGARPTSGLYNAISYIMTHYEHKITISDLANVENISVSRFCAVFKEQMGTSAVEFITKTRISAACDLLLSTDYSIGEIATMVGFSDANYFSKSFTKRLGIAPSEYRKSLKKL